MLKTQLQDGNTCSDTTIRKKVKNFNLEQLAMMGKKEFVKLTLKWKFSDFG